MRVSAIGVVIIERKNIILTAVIYSSHYLTILFQIDFSSFSSFFLVSCHGVASFVDSRLPSAVYHQLKKHLFKNGPTSQGPQCNHRIKHCTPEVQQFAPENGTGPQKKKILFQPSFFRGELLIFLGYIKTDFQPVLKKINEHHPCFSQLFFEPST